MSYALLIRHAQNDWVAKNRLAGWTPGVHLNDTGRSQAEKLAGRLEHVPLKAIYSSPLERCIETATAITAVHSLEIQHVEAMGEVRYGKWEGKKVKKLSKKPAWFTLQHYPSRFRFPGGESLVAVQYRAVQAIEELAARHKDEMFAIVSHADVIKLALAHYMGMHIDLFQRLVISTASVSLLALPESGTVRVVRVNDHGPIDLPPKPKEIDKTDHGTNHRTKTGEEHPEIGVPISDGSALAKTEAISETEEMTE